MNRIREEIGALKENVESQWKQLEKLAPIPPSPAQHQLVSTHRTQQGEAQWRLAWH